MSGHKTDRERILHIRDAIENIASFTSGINEENYLANILVQSAVERQLEIIGEAAANLSDEIRKKYPEAEWHKIKAFRNFIAHEYFGVSSRQIWASVVCDVPNLRTIIIRIIVENNW